MTPLSSTDYDAIRLSVQVAIAATVLSLPFGFAFAYLITFVRFRGKVLLEVLVNLPLTLPPVVVGYFLLLLLGKHGWLGSLLNEAGIPAVCFGPGDISLAHAAEEYIPLDEIDRATAVLATFAQSWCG